MAVPIICIPELRKEWVEAIEDEPDCKCLGCGSWEYKLHNKVWICIYCRSKGR